MTLENQLILTTWRYRTYETRFRLKVFLRFQVNPTTSPLKHQPVNNPSRPRSPSQPFPKAQHFTHQRTMPQTLASLLWPPQAPVMLHSSPRSQRRSKVPHSPHLRRLVERALQASSVQTQLEADDMAFTKRRICYVEAATSNKL